jgi:modification methylase
LHAVKGNPTLRHRYPDVLEGDVAQDSEHPTQKPADLLAKLIEATTDTGQVVVDPFAGSGSTVLEAQRLQRDFFAIELEEQWHRRIVDAVHTFARQEESAQEAHHGS